MDETVLPREFPGGRLRRLRASDCEAFQAYRGIAELGRYQGWSPMSEAEALAFLDEAGRSPLFVPGDWIQLGIAEPASDRLVGDIGLYLSGDGSSGEVGFTLAPSAQGRGIASRAVREAVQLMLGATRVERILGVTDARNLPSIRLLERLGFGFVESRRVEFRGEPCTERVYALLRQNLA
jgi:ribosomal-protein-alanine N-acetyltransferase